jgi:hypothetical protein
MPLGSMRQEEALSLRDPKFFLRRLTVTSGRHFSFLSLNGSESNSREAA